MHKKIFVRTLAVLLTFILCVTPMSIPASAVVIQENTFAPAAITTGVFWSNAEPYSFVARTLEYNTNNTSANTKSLSALTLSPTAVKDGLYAYRFTWTSNSPSVATVNDNTGDITIVGLGIAVITGTSAVFGSTIGQLTLVVFVVDDIKDLSMVALKGDVLDHTALFDDISDTWSSMGYTNERSYGNAASESRINAITFATYLASSKIFYFRGHGQQTSVLIDIGTAGSQTRFDTSFIDSMPTNAFSGCELVLYACCLTAQGGIGATNLVNATVSRGAQTVVGFQTKVYHSELYVWERAFFENLQDGKAVFLACARATTAVRTAATSYAHTCHICTEDCSIYCEEQCIENCTGYSTGSYCYGGNASATFPK